MELSPACTSRPISEVPPSTGGVANSVGFGSVEDAAAGHCRRQSAAAACVQLSASMGALALCTSAGSAKSGLLSLTAVN